MIGLVKNGAVCKRYGITCTSQHFNKGVKNFVQLSSSSTSMFTDLITESRSLLCERKSKEASTPTYLGTRTRS